MPDFVAGSQDLAMHLQVSPRSLLCSVYGAHTSTIGVTKVIRKRRRGEKADEKLRASMQRRHSTQHAAAGSWIFRGIFFFFFFLFRFSFFFTFSFSYLLFHFFFHSVLFYMIYNHVSGGQDPACEWSSQTSREELWELHQREVWPVLVCFPIFCCYSSRPPFPLTY